jgi:acyl-CoA synthetase (NDP forming)
VDLAASEGVNLPSLDSMAPWVRENLAGITVPNPLDSTGLGASLWPEIVQRYADSPDLDAMMYIHPLTDEDDSPTSRTLIDEFVKHAGHGKPFVISNCAGPLGAFVQERVEADPGVGVGHGLRSSLRGLAALGQFVRDRDRAAEVDAEVPTIARPIADLIDVPEGKMLPFADTMELLRDAGLPVAPYVVVPADAATVAPDFDGPYVVKLADVAHRTEHGAVRLRVAADELAGAVAEMRDLAARDGLSPLVAIQPMVDVQGEAFLGIQGQSELGPLMVFGLGGILVEVLNKIGGRMAPVSLDQARDLIAEFESAKLMHGFRGQPAWDLDALAGLLVRAGALASGGRSWIASLDINPLVYGADGFVAVDALCLLRNATEH